MFSPFNDGVWSEAKYWWLIWFIKQNYLPCNEMSLRTFVVWRRRSVEKTRPDFRMLEEGNKSRPLATNEEAKKNPLHLRVLCLQRRRCQTSRQDLLDDPHYFVWGLKKTFFCWTREKEVFGCLDRSNSYGWSQSENWFLFSKHSSHSVPKYWLTNLGKKLRWEVD